MATVTAYSAARMKQIEDAAIIDGNVVSDHLILVRFDGSQIDAGIVRGATGATGATGPAGPSIPSGAVMMWSSTSAPSGWLIADGTAISRSTYATLFAIIGTSYGTGDGTTTFNIPNLKGRVAVGIDSAQTEFNVLAKTGGAKTHALITGELPVHTHAVDPPNTVTDTQGSHTHNTIDGGNIVTTAAAGSAGLSIAAGGNPSSPYVSANGDHAHNLNIGSFTSGSTGSGTSHNNLQPFMCLPYIIKT